MTVDDPDLSVGRREGGVDPPIEPDLSEHVRHRAPASAVVPMPLAVAAVDDAHRRRLRLRRARVRPVDPRLGRRRHDAHTVRLRGPALFLWFFQWPATALAHGENPFYSTALFHPGGFNMLSQTSVMGLSVPLVPVTWIWGPVASLNVASTLTPAITAFSAFVVLRRWAPWTPAAFAGGLLYGFSPFVLTSLQYAHLIYGRVDALATHLGRP